MLKILYFLFIIKFRKLVSKDDNFAIILLVLLYCSVAFIVYLNYNSYSNYLYLLLLDISIKHLKRKDLDLLKLKKNHKTLLFAEYTIYLLPFYIVFLLREDFLAVLIFVVFKIVLLNAPIINFKTIPYPFQLFNPFWHINFRKYKLVLFLPIVLILCYLAINYNNDNLIYFAILFSALICCSPSFERERLVEIKLASFDTKQYLHYQFKNSIINTLYLVIPVIIILLLFLKLEIILFTAIILILPLVNILLKYIYFSNPLLQQMTFISFAVLSFTFYGIPLLITPLIYKKSIKALNVLRYARN